MRRKMVNRKAKANSIVKKESILSKMEPFTVVYGSEGSDMALESRLGRMVRATRESGRTTRRTVEAFSTMLTVMSLTVSGAMTRLMASAPISM